MRLELWNNCSVPDPLFMPVLIIQIIKNQHQYRHQNLLFLRLLTIVKPHAKLHAWEIIAIYQYTTFYLNIVSVFSPNLMLRPLQINFLFPVHRPHPQAGSRCGPIILLMTSHPVKLQFTSAIQPRFQGIVEGVHVVERDNLRPLLLQNAAAVGHL